MSNFSNFFDSSAILVPTLQVNFFNSRTWIVPQDGVIVVRALGAGGGGAYAATNGTGGYSGSWGAKALRVTKGEEITVSIGAAGVGRTQASGVGDGGAGGNTTVTIRGVAYVAYGGPGGKNAAVTALPNGPSPSANFDFGANSVKSGWASGTVFTGGAGVDIMAQGGNATTSAATTGSGGGGTGSPSIGSAGGGADGTSAATGAPAANPGVFADAGGGEWGISFYGGSGSIGTGTGGNGGGGSGSGSVGSAGGNGGGGGAASGTSGLGGGTGGRGAGGGAAANTRGGDGGGGFAHLKFFADMGI